MLGDKISLQHCKRHHVGTREEACQKVGQNLFLSSFSGFALSLFTLAKRSRSSRTGLLADLTVYSKGVSF